ncbi:MAG: hypothetical protein AB1571_00900 [Nanoarchaeota archaeon]
MQKRGKNIFILIHVLIILFSFNVIAARTYNYQNDVPSPLTNAQLYIYGCTDFTCLSLTTPYWFSDNSGASSSIIVDSGAPSPYNSEFHYVACYSPKERPAIISDYYSGTSTVTVTLSKKSSCSSTPSNLQIFGTKQINNELTILVSLAEVFSSSVSNLPSEVEGFYEGDTNVELWINNQLEGTKSNLKIPIGGTTTTFQWTPTTAGDYTIKIKTHVTDCQCSSVSDLETSTSITITSPPTCTDSCTTIGQKQCYNNTLLQTCTQNSCKYWANTTCPANQVCSNGACITQATTTCTPNWNCSQWSACMANNQQSRNCKDLNNCNVLTGRPALVQSCSAGGCTENWKCSGWGTCVNNEQARSCEDLSNCGTSVNKPSLIQQCTAEGAKTSGIGISERIKGIVGQGEENISAIKVLVEYKGGLPIALIVALVIIIIFVIVYKKEYYKPKESKGEGEGKKIVKIKPVKVTDLLMDVINSLDIDEKVIANKLIEGEGIEQEELRKELGMQKTRFEIALQKLERRQIIKEREGDNPRIFFNDWLK